MCKAGRTEWFLLFFFFSPQLYCFKAFALRLSHNFHIFSINNAKTMDSYQSINFQMTVFWRCRQKMGTVTGKFSVYQLNLVLFWHSLKVRSIINCWAAPDVLWFLNRKILFLFLQQGKSPSHLKLNKLFKQHLISKQWPLVLCSLLVFQLLLCQNISKCLSRQYIRPLFKT